MKLFRIPLLAFALCGGLLITAHAQSPALMLDFGQTAVASPYLTLSPGHDTGAVSLANTTWNTITSSGVNSSLNHADGTAASGITLSLGQEGTVGSGSISYTTPIANLNLVGTGGAVAGQQSLLGAGSIYGSDTSSTAAGRDGFFGGGTAAAGAAIGLRLDGLAAGDYFVYVMARNVNSNVGSQPMNVYTATGSSAGTFEFASLAASPQSNIGYASAGYAGQYNTFVNGENYVRLSVALSEGESLFLAADAPGTGSTLETRAFLNLVQIAAVPEPATMGLAVLGGLTLLALQRRGKAHSFLRSAPVPRTQQG